MKRLLSILLLLPASCFAASGISGGTTGGGGISGVGTGGGSGTNTTTVATNYVSHLNLTTQSAMVFTNSVFNAFTNAAFSYEAPGFSYEAASGTLTVSNAGTYVVNARFAMLPTAAADTNKTATFGVYLNDAAVSHLRYNVNSGPIGVESAWTISGMLTNAANARVQFGLSPTAGGFSVALYGVSFTLHSNNGGNVGGGSGDSTNGLASLAAVAASNAVAIATVLGVTQTNVSLSLVSNLAWGSFTNFNVFTNNGGNPSALIRGTYVYAGVSAGVNYWTNGVVAVYSNPPVSPSLGSPLWAYATNNGVPSTTNFIYYYQNGVDAQGYPNGVWSKLMGGAGLPQTGLRFLTTNTQTANPFAQVLSRYEILTPLQSNSVISRVEKWGSDTVGRIGGPPFATPYGALNTPTNYATDLLIGPGWWTNDYVNAAAMTLPAGMRVAGMGQGVTLLSVPQQYAINQFYGPFMLNNSNTLRNLTIYGVLTPTNASAQSISNLVIEDCTIGNATNIDCIFSSAVAPAGIYNATLNRVNFYSCWDTTTGIGSGELNDCNFYLDGALQPAQAIGQPTNGLRGIYVGISFTNTSYTIRGGKVVVRSITPPSQITTSSSTNCCLYFADTNATVTILGTEFYYPTGCVAVYSASVANTNALNLNGYFYQNGQLVTVTNGIFTTNGIELPAARLTGTVDPARLPTSSTNVYSLTTNSATAILNVTSNLTLTGSGTFSGTNTFSGGAGAIIITNGQQLIGNVSLTNSSAGSLLLGVTGGGNIRLGVGTSGGSFVLADKITMNYGAGDITLERSGSATALLSSHLRVASTITASNGFIAAPSWQTLSRTWAGLTNSINLLTNRYTLTATTNFGIDSVSGVPLVGTNTVSILTVTASGADRTCLITNIAGQAWASVTVTNNTTAYFMVDCTGGSDTNVSWRFK